LKSQAACAFKKAPKRIPKTQLAFNAVRSLFMGQGVTEKDRERLTLTDLAAPWTLFDQVGRRWTKPDGV
jgi:hypothetical protein